jgi:hypothetical protein
MEAWLARHGGPIDRDWLIDIVVRSPGDLSSEFSDGDEDSVARQAIAIKQLEAARLLQASSLLPEQAARLCAAMSTCEPASREHIWNIAATHQLAALDAIALDIAERARNGSTDEIGAVCKFAAHRQWPSEIDQAFTDRICEYVRRDDIRFTWDLAQAWTYLVARGMGDLVRHHLADHLDDWFAAYDQVETGKARLRIGSRDISETHGYCNHTSLELVLLPFRDVVHAVGHKLSADQRIRFLSVELDDGWHDTLFHLLDGIPEDDLDRALVALPDGSARATALIRLSPHGATPVRVATLCRLISGMTLQSIAMNLLDTVHELWSHSVAEPLVKAVVDCRWDDDFSDHVVHRLVAASLPFDRTTLSGLLKPALASAIHEKSRTVLEVWAEAARLRREQSE